MYYLHVYLDGVATVTNRHAVDDPQGHLQAVLGELAKLPGASPVAAVVPHPNLAGVIEHILTQIGGVGVVTAILYNSKHIAC